MCSNISAFSLVFETTLRLFRLIFFVFALSSLAGCSLLPETVETNISVETATTLNARISQIQSLSTWQAAGKIAFLQSSERSSANFSWQKTDELNQQINLTTYLGINVMQLKSIDGLHQITVEGETYDGKHLDTLIYQLTQLNFPSEALNFWLKGLAYSASDKITYQKNGYLPQTLISEYNHQRWQVDYQKYTVVNGYQLPSQLTVKQGNFTIKIRINQWTL